MRRTIIVLLVLLVLGCTSTAGTKATLVSGGALALIGNQFADAAEAYTAGCASGAITSSKCASFRAFGLRFKDAYPKAQAAWEAARAANSQAQVDALAPGVAQLQAELAAYALTVPWSVVVK